MRPNLVPPHVRKRARRRHQRLARLGFADYPDYLRSGVWKAIKARYRASARPQRCVCCDGDEVQLHHLTYVRVGGDELLTDLVPLCGRCHRLMHILEARGDAGLDPAEIYDDERAAQHRLARVQNVEAQRRALRSLALAEQLAILRAMPNRAVHNQLRVIEAQVARAERIAVTGGNSAKGTQALRAVERNLPKLLDEALEAQLVDPHAEDMETANLRMLTFGQPDPEALVPVKANPCDETYDCICDVCTAERISRVRQGVRQARQPWDTRRAA